MSPGLCDAQQLYNSFPLAVPACTSDIIIICTIILVKIFIDVNSIVQINFHCGVTHVCIHIAGDSAHDLTILANQSQFIAWAIGPRATEAGLGNLAFFHTEYPRNGGTNFVQF